MCSCNIVIIKNIKLYYNCDNMQNDMLWHFCYRKLLCYVCNDHNCNLQFCGSNMSGIGKNIHNQSIQNTRFNLHNEMSHNTKKPMDININIIIINISRRSNYRLILLILTWHAVICYLHKPRKIHWTRNRRG